MTNEEFKALVDADIRRLMKQAEDQIIAENLQRLINRSKQYMNDRDWDKEDLYDDKEEREPRPDDDTIFADDEYTDDLRDRYNEVKFWK